GTSRLEFAAPRGITGRELERLPGAAPGRAGARDLPLTAIPFFLSSYSYIIHPLQFCHGKRGFCMRREFVTLCVIALVAGMPLFGQEVSAGITGRVTDPSGSAIVGAKVNAKDMDRGTDWPTVSNEDGIYAFPRIPVGKYQVKVEAQGFKSKI